MKSIEENAIDTFRQFCELWSTRDENSLDELLYLFDENYKGFGTVVNEVWKSKKSVKCQLESEFRQLPEGFSCEILWIDAKLVSEAVVNLISELKLTVHIPPNYMVIEPIRFSVVLKQTEDGLKIVQSHASVPDSAADEEEVFPGINEPKRYEEVSVMFTDFVDFTNIVSMISANKLVEELNEIFGEFDNIVGKQRIDKVKTIGDSYMAVAGLKESGREHAARCILAAKEMLRYLEKRNTISDCKWDMRVGIHSGPVIGGVIGSDKLVFDLWGDTVNLASKMESSGEANMINISSNTHAIVKERFSCSYRGKIEAKGTGKIKMYFVD